MIENNEDKRIERFSELLTICEDLLETLAAGLAYVMNYTDENAIPLQGAFYDRMGIVLKRASRLLEELKLPPPSLQHRFRNTEEDNTTGGGGSSINWSDGFWLVMHLRIA